MEFNDGKVQLNTAFPNQMRIQPIEPISRGHHPGYVKAINMQFALTNWQVSHRENNEVPFWVTAGDKIGAPRAIHFRKGMIMIETLLSDGSESNVYFDVDSSYVHDMCQKLGVQ